MQETEQLINAARECKTWSDIRKTGKKFAANSGFRHFFILCSYFDNYNSPFTNIITNYCQSPRFRHSISTFNMLDEITTFSMNSVTPVVRGKLRDRRSLKINLPRNVTHIRKHDQHSSISFPVQFPEGLFMLFHIGTHTRSTIDYRQTMIDGFQFGLAICESFQRTIAKPFPEIHLSSQEKRCLIMACDGISPRLTSEKLGLSVHTIQYYLKNARKKLHSNNLQHALSHAINQGMLKSGDLTGSLTIKKSKETS